LLFLHVPPPALIYTLSLHYALPIYFAAVGRRIAPEQPFGVGLRLSALALEQLAASPGELERFAAALADANLYVFTINGFPHGHLDRKSTRLNSSHVKISYAVFCLKK